jgi:hypothetical protein
MWRGGDSYNVQQDGNRERLRPPIERVFGCSRGRWPRSLGVELV